MFLFEAEKQEFGMKPMNCPGHCLMFKHQNRSYRGEPISPPRVPMPAACSMPCAVSSLSVPLSPALPDDRLVFVRVSPGTLGSKCSLFVTRVGCFASAALLSDLPWRVADFGVLHRNEFSGALTGLTRVRRFQQDDAHIFCTPEQIADEMAGALAFLRDAYEIFGFTLSMALSTRPEKFLGEIETWNNAEKILADALNKSGFEWKLNPGDGAFYGPKVCLY